MQAGLATRPDSVQDVATIEAPVLAMAGGEDPGVRRPRWRFFTPHRGDASFTCYPMPGTSQPMSSRKK